MTKEQKEQYNQILKSHNFSQDIIEKLLPVIKPYDPETWSYSKNETTNPFTGEMICQIKNSDNNKNQINNEN